MLYFLAKKCLQMKRFLNASRNLLKRTGMFSAFLSQAAVKGFDVIIEMLANVNLEMDLGLAAFIGRIVVSILVFKNIISYYDDLLCDYAFGDYDDDEEQVDHSIIGHGNHDLVVAVMIG